MLFSSFKHKLYACHMSTMEAHQLEMYTEFLIHRLNIIECKASHNPRANMLSPSLQFRIFWKVHMQLGSCWKKFRRKVILVMVIGRGDPGFNWLWTIALDVLQENDKQKWEWYV